MKTKARLRLILTLALLAAVTSRAQTWDSENVLLPSPNFAPAGGGHAVLVDPFNSTPAPGVFLGINNDGSGSPTIWRLTPTNAASSSFTVADVDSALTDATRLANNAGDALYAAGYAPVDPKAMNITYVWKVRKSAAQGNVGTWTTDDTFFLTKNAEAYAWGMTTDSLGNVFVSGVANDGRTPHWVVRRKTPGGAWVTVYDVKGQNVNMVPAMCFYPGVPGDNQRPAAVFTVSDINSKWTVLRSQNQGAIGTWAAVDTWPGVNDALPGANNSETTAYDAVYDSQSGNIYVVGCRGLNGKNPSAWVIRMSADGGNNWNTLLDVTGPGSWASRAAMDGAGNVSVSGVINPSRTSTSSGTPLWKVIRCADPQNASSWLASFANGLLPFDGTYSKGRGITADPAGNLFVTGDVVDWTDSTDPLNPVFYPGDHVGLLRLVPAP